MTPYFKFDFHIVSAAGSHDLQHTIVERDADLLYSDEDKIDARGRLRAPAFKPDFSPDWLLSCNFVSHLGV